ncbi:unnamed protein product [Cylindrotheca closterium]|uniref:Ataxin-10 domain-containing protein n=1 Tax=Cylindrotheca closterium TaxID=2856 RepID=A0AAD2GE11_9STRA|nr:unnamed protein product [Cylindrotheca closterium]
MMAMWKEALQDAQEIRCVEPAHRASDWEQMVQNLKKLFSDLSQQISRYQTETLANRQREKEEVKELILTTRTALRYGLCCVSFQDEEARVDFQNHAVLNCDTHSALTRVLCMNKADSKCRLLSAQLMSNLVTCNEATAESLTSALSVAPPEDKMVARIFASNFSGSDDKSNEESSSDTTVVVPPNWVDCFIFSIKSDNRGAAAAVTAALHNCVCALESKIDHRQSFIEDVASDPILISSMLRNFIPAKRSIESEDYGEWDQATEWINLLLTKLIRLGMIGRMYIGISRCPLSDMKCVLPEQNVLLHCMVKQLEDERDVEEMLDQVGLESFEFLANLFCKLKNLSKTGSGGDEMLLLQSAVISILEISSTFLAIDSVGCSKVRNHLGTTTEFLPQCATLLANIVDVLAKRNEGVKAREMKMSPEEQDQITLLVRVVGNLCFRCKQNQDLMRSILLPMASTSHTGDEDTNNNNPEQRNALHVLLSCTTFATACFTLREWSVIAIRNVLEDNPSNQEIVAQLDANGPIQTAALSEAGLKVQLDSKGKVSLSTLKEEN